MPSPLEHLPRVLRETVLDFLMWHDNSSATQAELEKVVDAYFVTPRAEPILSKRGREKLDERKQLVLRGAFEEAFTAWYDAACSEDYGARSRLIDEATKVQVRALAMLTEIPPGIDALIEASSLGTPEANALRDSTPPEVVDAVMDRVHQAEVAELREALAEAEGKITRADAELARLTPPDSVLARPENMPHGYAFYLLDEPRCVRVHHPHVMGWLYPSNDERAAVNANAIWLKHQEARRHAGRLLGEEWPFLLAPSGGPSDAALADLARKVADIVQRSVTEPEQVIASVASNREFVKSHLSVYSTRDNGKMMELRRLYETTRRCANEYTGKVLRAQRLMTRLRQYVKDACEFEADAADGAIDAAELEGPKLLAKIDQWLKSLESLNKVGDDRSQLPPKWLHRPGFGYVREGVVVDTIPEAWAVVDEERVPPPVNWPEIERRAHEVIVQWAIDEALNEHGPGLPEAIEALRDVMPRDAFKAEADRRVADGVAGSDGGS